MAFLVRLLGTAYASEPGGDVRLPGDKRGCLLAYLACSGDWVSRERLAFLFWPDADERSAKRNLRQLLNRVKKLPLSQPLELTPSHVRWQVETDVSRFRRALAQTDYAGAVELYRGALLSDFPVREASGFEAWLELERENLHRAFRHAALHHAQALEAAGQYEEASAHLKTLLDGDPLAEDVLQRYLRVLYLGGQRDTALEVYARFARRLEEELALEPLEATQELVATVRRATPIERVPPPKTRHPPVPVSVLRPPRLVGREHAFQAVRAATTPVVLISGEPGIGKTYFLQVLLPDAAWTRCHEGLESVPYAPLIAFIRAHLQHLPDLGPYREDLARLVPEVAPGLTPAPLEPQTAKARLLEALARVKAPFEVPIILDDMQWADPATLEALVFLAAHGQRRCYGAYRSGEESPALRSVLESLRASGLVTVIHLDALTEGALQALLADLMGTECGPALFSRWLWGRSSGNPMFALETLKALFESGVLRSDKGGWHTDIDDVTRDYSELEVPPAVSEVVMHRISRLPAQTARVLQTAAVVQGGFDASLLGRVSGLSEWAVLEALEEAEGAGLIEGDGFRHDLLRQAVYQALPERRKRLLHGRVAEALGGTADAAVTAEHWCLAGNLARAAACWTQAAAGLRRRGLHHQASTLLERVARLVPETAQTVPLVRLRLTLAKLLADAGRYDEASRVARDLLDRVEVPAYRALALHLLGLELIYEGKARQAERVMLEAVALHDPAVSKDLDFYPLTDLGYAKALLGKACEARELWERERQAHEKEAPSAHLVMLLIMIGGFHDRDGDPAEGLRMHERALELARRIGAKHYEAWAAYNILNSSLQGGRELSEPAALAEAVLELGDYSGTPFLRDALTEVYLRLERYADAERHIGQLMGQAPATMVGLVQVRHAELCFATGRACEGRLALEEAVRHLGQSEYPAFTAHIALSVLRHGDDAMIREVRPYVAHVRRGGSAVHPYLLHALEQALAARAA